MIVVKASKARDEDKLKQFDVSKSVNGGALVSIDKYLMSGDGASIYYHGYGTAVDTTSGQKSKYIFTVTSNDGFSNSVSLTVTTQ